MMHAKSEIKGLIEEKADGLYVELTQPKVQNWLEGKLVSMLYSASVLSRRNQGGNPLDSGDDRDQDI